MLTQWGAMSERGDIPANGIRLAYFTSGRADGPPLVLLHSLGEPSATWDEIAPELGREYQLIAFDLRGHGDSDWPGEYSFELMRDDVLDALDQLGLEQVSIIGHSLGGTVASLVAEARPALVRQLVLEDTCPPKPPAPAPRRGGAGAGRGPCPRRRRRNCRWTGRWWWPSPGS